MSIETLHSHRNNGNMIFIKLLDEKKLSSFFFSPVSDQERSTHHLKLVCVFFPFFFILFFFLNRKISSFKKRVGHQTPLNKICFTDSKKWHMKMQEL